MIVGRMIGGYMSAQVHSDETTPAAALIGRALLEGAAAPLGRLGSLEVRFARDADEVERAQRLRYRTFFEEGSALPDPAARLTELDRDGFDPFCRHLVVVDRAGSRPGAVIGTCRLLTREAAERAGGFYSETEFDLAPMLARHADLRLVELGRFCVGTAYRDRRTVELLWQGIWWFVRSIGADAMIGCASLDGTDPERLAPQLALLHGRARSPEEWRVRARPHLAVPTDRLRPAEFDARAVLRTLPPLVKAYLRLGATIGEGAVVDRHFGTTDIFVVLPVAKVERRYRSYFAPELGRLAA